MLVLPIKKKWFDMIKSGEKKEEYREIKSYYTSRFCKILNLENSFPHLEYCLDKFNFPPVPIRFRNGYKSTSPTIQCKVTFSIGYGKEEWGAEPKKRYYVLKILNVEDL